MLMDRENLLRGERWLVEALGDRYGMHQSETPAGPLPTRL